MVVKKEGDKVIIDFEGLTIRIESLPDGVGLNQLFNEEFVDEVRNGKMVFDQDYKCLSPAIRLDGE